MPTWVLNLLITYLIPLALSILQQYGIPALEQKFPTLIPLINEIITLLGQTTPVPSAELKSASDHFNGLLSAKKV